MPLHFARNAEIAELFLRCGADAGAVDADGTKPIHTAQTGDIARLLLDRWADPNEHDLECSTPLHYASGLPDVVSVPIEAGAEVRARTINGHSPLHLAALEHDESARILIEAGADVHVRDNNGNTPLHIAASRLPKSIPVLLSAGADIDARNKKGETPLHVAARSHHPCVAVLLDAGADPTIRDKKKRLPEDRVLGKEKYARDSYDPRVKERLVAAREAMEFASVATEGRSEGRSGRRRI